MFLQFKGEKMSKTNQISKNIRNKEINENNSQNNENYSEFEEEIAKYQENNNKMDKKENSSTNTLNFTVFKNFFFDKQKTQKSYYRSFYCNSCASVDYAWFWHRLWCK